MSNVSQFSVCFSDSVCNVNLLWNLANWQALQTLKDQNCIDTKLKYYNLSERHLNDASTILESF